jgi:hypothetical protein
MRGRSFDQISGGKLLAELSATVTSTTRLRVVIVPIQHGLANVAELHST